MGRFFSENLSGATRLLKAGSSCAQQNAATGTNRGCDSGARSLSDNRRILALGTSGANGAAQLAEAGSAVAPTSSNRFTSENRVFQLRDPWIVSKRDLRQAELFLLGKGSLFTWSRARL
jgi:hypothetical protein